MKLQFAFFRRLVRYAGPSLWRNAAASVLVGTFAGASALALLPLLGLIGLAETNWDAPALEAASAALRSLPPAVALAIALGAYVSFSVLQYALQRAVTIRNVALMQGFGRELRLGVYEALLRADWLFFLKARKTDLTTSLTSDIARVIHGTHVVLQFVSSIAFTVVQAAIALWLSPQITAFVLLCGTALALVSRKRLEKAKELGGSTSELGKAYLAEVTDQLNGMKEIKSNNLAESRLDGIRSLTDGMVREQLGYVRLKTSTDLFYQSASAALVAAFVFVSVTLFQAKLDQLLIVLVIFARLWPRFAGMQASLQQLASSMPAFEAIERLERDCRAFAERTAEPEEEEERAPFRLERGIECRDVSFRYGESGDAEYALRDVRLFVPADRTTAIVGRSGAGKSTLVDTLMGLIRPERGDVLVDGRRLSDAEWAALRDSIGYVPQEPYLFNGTIRDNLRMTQPRATEEQMWRALSFAAADDFVAKLPEGLDTTIGDRGIRLSGGERQRLVLARAMLRKPSILILDEATSALDAENESKIQEALERLQGRVTVVVIAHRLSTIRHADQVVVLERGRIAQAGPFRELAEDRDGAFGRLLANQWKPA